MAFWGCSFSFNGTPCEEFDLMMYDVGGSLSEDDMFGSNVEILEEQVGRRWKPQFYGARFSDKLAIELIFGVNQSRIDEGRFLSRYEINDITTWLTGHDEYMWLEINQTDMDHVRYRCMITELSMINYGLIPWAMRATAVCDGPYAYMHPIERTYAINGNRTIDFTNESAYNGYYRPKLELTLPSGGNFSITNENDNGRKFEFTNVPAGASKIYIDNDTFVITNDGGINIYPNFNYKFLRLVRGNNRLKVSGNGTLKIICEFPVNVGS